MHNHARPQPPDTALTRPYWQAAAEGRLVIQHCTQCHQPRHYPRLMCARCHSTAYRWLPVSGRGRIHSWTVTHHAFHPAFKGELPYTLITVDLDEGVRSLGRWLGGEPSIGAAVQGRFRKVQEVPELVFEPWNPSGQPSQGETT
jgi:uncharacterized OB-fold protein